MFGLGVGEIALVLVIVLVVFGGTKLPELGAGLGEGVKNFRKGLRDSKSIDVTPGAEKDGNAGADKTKPPSSGNNS